MSSKSIGDSTEKRIIDFLKTQGYETFKPTRTKYGIKDIFNKYDILARHNQTGSIKLIQAKTNSTRGVLKTIKEEQEKYGKVYVSYELWVYNSEKKIWRAYTRDGIENFKLMENKKYIAW